MFDAELGKFGERIVIGRNDFVCGLESQARHGVNLKNRIMAARFLSGILAFVNMSLPSRKPAGGNCRRGFSHDFADHF